ncbi:unnamed protein product [Acidithrix sp. C25]|nr:unnamed protein product [Acidithrix sp. C25]
MEEYLRCIEGNQSKAYSLNLNLKNRRLKNRRLKSIVVDLTLDVSMLNLDPPKI